MMMVALKQGPLYIEDNRRLHHFANQIQLYIDIISPAANLVCSDSILNTYKCSYQLPALHGAQDESIIGCSVFRG